MATNNTIDKLRNVLFPGSEKADLSSDMLSKAIININQYKTT